MLPVCRKQRVAPPTQEGATLLADAKHRHCRRVAKRTPAMTETRRRCSNALFASSGKVCNARTPEVPLTPPNGGSGLWSNKDVGKASTRAPAWVAMQTPRARQAAVPYQKHLTCLCLQGRVITGAGERPEGPLRVPPLSQDAGPPNLCTPNGGRTHSVACVCDAASSAAPVAATDRTGATVASASPDKGPGMAALPSELHTRTSLGTIRGHRLAEASRRSGPEVGSEGPKHRPESLVDPGRQTSREPDPGRTPKFNLETDVGRCRV